MSTSTVDIQQLAINSIRTLSMDAVQAANSGHPGTPMALAPVAYALWSKHLKYDPANPNWMARDRFVLSCGHASMLLYSVLHLAQVKSADGKPAVSLDNIKNFRQLHSPCAGHPEYGEAAGIETTTGPLGQGLGNSVGMAVASRWLAARFGEKVCGFDVYTLCSDGDVMEGVGCEAASLAGHLKLSNLCWIYDDNNITIEGRTELAFSEDVATRFKGLGWHVVQVDDANDIDAIDKAIEKFKSNNDKPTLIVLKSIIGFGSPNKQDTSSAHGSPLGDDEITLAKKHYDWSYEKFEVPDEVYENLQETLGARGAKSYSDWEAAWGSLAAEAKSELETITADKLPDGWRGNLPKFDTDAKGMATRAASGKVLNAVAAGIPWLVGGSADLAGSNKSFIDGVASIQGDDFSGRNMHFGIREHAMASMCNGMSLSGIRPYCATFFVFTDYLRPALRLSALMHQPVFYILTHDSIGLGEDGPTHQPVEHLAACRAIPNLLVMRPADANETAWCYEAAMSQTDRPTAIVLTRQSVPTMDADALKMSESVKRGAYVVRAASDPKVILMGTGSELPMCVEAAEVLAKDGVEAQVVSMPCWELFDEQPAEYREQVLPRSVTARVAVEAGIQQGWDRYLGTDGQFIGMSSFGASAPFETLYEHFGITVDAIVKAAKAKTG